ncbi:hypothetical protein CNYM01_13599 [Colletotrichum nymphaeae SA-01]|uniref:Uncharacterized protein n=1 Tax=Colletotrichum nymphaeae SA-01 TaxID=1460502 RepID=A0A135T8H1_9PEZI|nr:hypothetical protein CNYM01_13599 [Colletotrichum nymphaeae SA-01]
MKEAGGGNAALRVWEGVMPDLGQTLDAPSWPGMMRSGQELPAAPAAAAAARY